MKYTSTSSDLHPILMVQVGSRLWGTNTEESDNDYRTIVTEPLDSILDPFSNVKPVSRYDDDDTDTTFYELRHFARLAMQGNPTLMEVLFSPHVIFRTSRGQILRNNRWAFVGTEEVYQSHRGYVAGEFDKAAKLMQRQRHPYPAQRIGKLLSSAILGATQYEPLMYERAEDFENLLLPVERDSHISLKRAAEPTYIEKKRHAYLLQNKEMYLGNMESVYKEVSPRQPDYTRVRQIVRNAYLHAPDELLSHS